MCWPVSWDVVVAVEFMVFCFRLLKPGVAIAIRQMQMLQWWGKPLRKRSKGMRFAFMVLAVLLIQSVGFAQGIPEKAERILDKAAKALADEAERLVKIGKDKDAEVVTDLIKDLDNEMLKRKGTPEAAKVRQSLFSKRIVGNWSRLTFPSRYEILPNGMINDFSPAGQATNHAKFVRFVSEQCVEYKWDSGHIWHVHYANPSVLAVTETLADVRANDGFVLERKQ